MKSRELKTLLGRIQAWPPGAQKEAVKALREIEEEFFIGPQALIEMQQSHNEALRGEGVSLDDLKERLGL
jgi:hypothetical protein